MKYSAFIALAALAAAMAQGAYAKPADAVLVRNVVVHYGDLNLGTARGKASLHERITQAAASACGGNPVFSSHYRDAPAFVTQDFEQCRARAAGEALSEIRDRYAAR